MFDPFSAEAIACPEASYAALRELSGLYRSEILQAWVVTRMDDARQVLTDPSFIAVEVAGSLREIARRTGRDYRHLIRFLDAVLFFRDGAEHERERRTIAKVMNAIKIGRVEGVAQQIADELAADLSRLDRFDAAGDFAEPLPRRVMAYILGIPDENLPVLNDLLSDVTLIFGPTSLATYDRLEQQTRGAFDLIMRCIAEAVEADLDNGLRQIHDAAEGEGGERLMNAAATAMFVFRVGVETTIGLLGLMVREIVAQPPLIEAARSSPDAIDAIVSEVLRLESNVQRAGRVATEDRIVGGTPVRSGDRILLLVGAANRDPACFDQPDRLMPEARRPSDLSFGAGKHYCLGATLARIEARAALKALLGLPPLAFDGQQTWYQSHVIRRLTSLPVRFER